MRGYVETYGLLVSGLGLQTATLLAPFDGTIVGIDWAAVQATVTSGAELVAVVTLTQAAASADWDANLSGKTNVLSIIRQRCGTTDGLTGVAYSCVNKYVPVSQRVSARQPIYLQSTAATNACAVSVLLQIVKSR